MGYRGSPQATGWTQALPEDEKVADQVSENGRVYDSAMNIELKRIAVIGSTGPTGIHLVRELAGRGRRVLAISRRLGRLDELFADEQGVETAAADAIDAGASPAS